MFDQKGFSSLPLIPIIILLLIIATFAFFFGTRVSPELQESLPKILPTQQPSPTVGLANPASTNCIEEGGTLSMKTRGDGGEYGVCNFEDGLVCEEWALYRGDCPKGGVKITGFDTEAQMYCAMLGGQTLAEPDATCTFDDGSVCSDEALFNGTCHKGKY